MQPLQAVHKLCCGGRWSWGGVGVKKNLGKKAKPGKNWGGCQKNLAEKIQKMEKKRGWV